MYLNLIQYHDMGKSPKPATSVNSLLENNLKNYQ